MGFYHYLKYYCDGQRTWAGQQTELPAVLPALKTAIKVTTVDRSVIVRVPNLDLTQNCGNFTESVPGKSIIMVLIYL